MIPTWASWCLDKLASVCYTVYGYLSKGITYMTNKVKNIGLMFDIAVCSVVVLLNELAAFLYIRDNIRDQGVAYFIAGFAVFTSTYIIGKLIARLLK